MFLGLWRDLIHAVRSLAKARTFTFVCVVSLGIGMTPIIAIFFGARLFRMPPAGVQTEGLVEVITTPRGGRPAANNWSYPDFVDLRAADTGIAMTGWIHGDSETTIQTAAGTQRTSVGTMFVSANYFRTIGVALARGPGFDAAVDDPLRADPTVIVGHNFWQNNLGSDPDIVGKTLTLDGIPHVVVGVAPEHFSGHLVFQGRALFVPLERHPRLRDDKDNVRLDRGTEWLHIHGRLSPGVSVAQASAAVSAVTSRLAAEYPATNEVRAGIAERYNALGGGDTSATARIQAIALTLTGTVLLVICLNLSGMMQVRSAMRERELSVRQAIGATRGRLARYLLSEAIVLAGLGGLLAVVVLRSVLAMLPRWVGRPLPVQVQEALRLDPSMIALCIGLCLVTSLVFGLLPAIRFSRPVILSSLKDDAGVGGFRAGRVHRFTAALQVAIAVPLMVMSGMALERVRFTATADLGFDSDLLYAAGLNFGDAAAESVASRIRSVRDNLETASGVASVTVADHLPMDFGGGTTRVSLQGDADTAPRIFFARVTRVGDGYLDTMGIPLLFGRGFTADDGAGADMVTIISNTLAGQLVAQLVPGAAPSAVIGQRLTYGTDEKTQHTLTIVGITGDVPTSQMSTERAQLLVPMAQHPSPTLFVVARSAAGEQPMKVTAALENAVRDLGPDVDRSLTYADDLPLARIVTGVWLRQNSVRDYLVQSTMAAVSGGVILTLAALGVYGVVGLMVATRTREIAVRVALGASRRRVLGMIVVDVVRLVAPGVAVGLVMTAAMVRFNVPDMGISLSNVEPLAFIAGAAVAVLVAVLASLVPARRAASVQPMLAMRSV